MKAVARQNRPWEVAVGPHLFGAMVVVASTVGASVGDANLSNWAVVAALEPGTEVIVTLPGLQPERRYVVHADEYGLTALNVSSPALPPDARSALIDAASDNPDSFEKALRGEAIRVNRHVRFANRSVVVDDREALDVSAIVDDIDRGSVVEVRLVDRAVKRGAGWGAVAGVAVGTAAVFLNCGAHWDRETPTCRNLTGIMIPFATGIGTGVGAAVGAGSRISTTIYRAEQPDVTKR